MKFFWALFIPLAFTVLVETLALCFFKDRKKRLLPQLYCNLITNPLLHLILPLCYMAISSLCGGENKVLNAVALLALEIAIVFAEAWLAGLFIQEPYKKRLQISAILNALSFGLGVVFSAPLEALFYNMPF